MEKGASFFNRTKLSVQLHWLLRSTAVVCSLDSAQWRTHLCPLRVFGISRMSSEGNYDVLIGCSSWVLWLGPKVKCDSTVMNDISHNCLRREFPGKSSRHENANSIFGICIHRLQATTLRGPACMGYNMGPGRLAQDLFQDFVTPSTLTDSSFAK